MIYKFSPLELQILEMRFVDRISTAEIQMKLNIPPSKVLELETKAIKNVFNILSSHESTNN